MNKPGFTLQKHKETGKQLDDAREKAMALSLEIAKAYPVASKATRKAQAVLTAVDALRLALLNCQYRETGEDGHYYG